MMGKKRKKSVPGEKRKGKTEGRKEEAQPGRNKRPAVRAGSEGGAGKGWGAQNTHVSFLNLLGVCVSNKDKGGNDYSVKSMVLDCANTN